MNENVLGHLILALLLIVPAVVEVVLLIGFDRIANRGPKHPKQLAVLWVTAFLLILPAWVLYNEIEAGTETWAEILELFCLVLFIMIPLALLWVTGKWFIRK